jgi:folate-dependent phosphoribosylglycinamide formyltransferase PurN
MRKLYEPREDSPARVIVFMSGSGTNLVELLRHRQSLLDSQGKSPFDVVGIFTNNTKPANNAQTIGDVHGIEVVTHDFPAFRAANKLKRGSIERRVPYFEQVNASLLRRNADFVVFAGYELLITQPLLSNLIIKVHPADLSVRNEDGTPRYAGLRVDPIIRAILAGEQSLRSSTQLIIGPMDQGPVLLISTPMPIDLKGKTLEWLRRDWELGEEIGEFNQNRLKSVGDWVVLPLTVEMVAEGRFAVSAEGVMHLDAEPIPLGYKMSDDEAKAMRIEAVA